MTLNGIFKMATGQTCEYWMERGELDWFDKYADPRRDSGKGVLTANWNEFPRKGDHEYNWGKGRKFQDLLEKMGYQIEWSDQTTRCDHCYGCITTDADYYGDTAHYAILGECDAVCEHCIRTDFAEEYLEGLENNHRGAVNISGINPAEHGYELVEGEFESGFHPGQTDNPRAIFERLREKYDRLLFVIDGAGQFDVRFSIWRKVSEVEEAV